MNRKEEKEMATWKIALPVMVILLMLIFPPSSIIGFPIMWLAFQPADRHNKKEEAKRNKD